MHNHEMKKVIEALILTSSKPLSLGNLRAILEETQQMTESYLRGVLEEMKKDCEENRGVILTEVAGGYQFRTHPKMALWLKKLEDLKPLKMSRAPMEALAIIAYKQPITKAEIEDIRGVDSGHALKTLLETSLIKISGRREDVGRPLLYRTTDYFLEFFNLNNLKDLPSLKEFEEIQVKKLDFTNHLKQLKQMDEVSYDFLTGKQLPPPIEES